MSAHALVSALRQRLDAATLTPPRDDAEQVQQLEEIKTALSDAGLALGAQLRACRLRLASPRTRKTRIP